MLKGNVTGYPEGKIYFHYSAGDSTIVDSCEVKNGSFAFKGNLEEPTNALLANMPKYVRGADYQALNFFIEPDSRMDLTADWIIDSTTRRVQNYELTGSMTNDDYLGFKNEFENLNSREEMPQLLSSFIKTHPNSFMSVYLLSRYVDSFDLEKLEQCESLLGDTARAYSPMVEVNKAITSLKRIQIGEKAPDFTRTDLNGNTFKLSDFMGKTVLLDFWASWCGPCRESMPHVKSLYAKYHKAGLEVICIGDNDSLQDKWKEAIEKDGTSDFIHTLRGLKRTENGFDRSDDLDDLYTVHTIPSKFLIDRDGVLRGIKVEDAALDSLLTDIFGF